MARIVWVDDEPETSLLVEELRKYVNNFLPQSDVEWWPDAANVSAQRSISDATCFILDHRWQGASAESMVERIFSLNPDSRVIVCSGKPLDPMDLIKLGRLGIFSYWVKPIDMTMAGRIIVDVCVSPTAALGSLRRDGLVNLLVERATKQEREFTALKARFELTARERDALRSGTANELQREILGIVKISVPIILVALSVVLVKRLAGESSWVILGSVALGTAASLFLDRAIQKFGMKTKNFQIDMSTKPEAPQAGSIKQKRITSD